MDKVSKSDEQLQSELEPEQYWVTRKKGTERPFTGRYYDTREAGMYHCVCCGEPLFSSETKFDAGCGWPSFFQAVAEKVVEEPDRSHGMVRTEILCKRCDAHLGHVFDDGPAPTGLRYCVNSASLDFRNKENDPDEETSP